MVRARDGHDTKRECREVIGLHKIRPKCLSHCRWETVDPCKTTGGDPVTQLNPRPVHQPLQSTNESDPSQLYDDRSVQDSAL